MTQPKAGKQKKITSVNNYKTELCRHFPNCPFGARCTFAHGEAELRCQSLNEMAKGGQIPSAEHYRQLPCKTFITLGCCPYREKCVFIHDPRIKCAAAARVSMPGKSISAPEHSGKDFWWPEMDAHLTFAKTDSKGRPDVEQHYLIPTSYITHYSFAERGVYSMWSHFCGYCSADPLFLEDNSPQNMIIHTSRLPVFRTLATGESIIPEPPAWVSWSEYIAATSRKDSIDSVDSDDAPRAVLAPGEQSPSTVAINIDMLIPGSSIKLPGRKTPRAADILAAHAAAAADAADLSDFGLA